INGYVLEITDRAEFAPEKQKEIAAVVHDSSPADKNMIRLAFWMKENYGSTMITALKTVLPIKKKIRKKEEKTVRLLLTKEAAIEQLAFFEKKHQTARARILRELLQETCIDYRLVTGKLNIVPATLQLMAEQKILCVEAKRIYRNTVHGETETEKKILNEFQRPVADEIISDYRENIRKTYLIRGVTGSGKTEIYMEVIEEVVRSGRQVIVLIPEIALTYQTVMRFYRRFGERVSTLHSKLSDGERYDQFERAKCGEIDVMIGPRSALFTPFERLGLIVIDEEHESSYKSDAMPKYHAREVAQELAGMYGASVILGSATPSMEAYEKALRGEYKLFSLDNRVLGASMPRVSIVDLREELKEGNRSVFSRMLREKIEDRLTKGEQVMLFLNRRGYAGFVSCRSCGHVMKCPHCDVSLSKHGNGRLVCHYCGYEQDDVKVCPECGSSFIGGMRAGTEQIEMQIKKAFPYAAVLRMDADTTKKKGGYDNILSAFANRDADILVGTQMIVKGHDFPYVTLVGILAADLSLHVNDYRASERTFQLLTQAAGRAGRAERPGEVVIQTYNPDHYSILAAAKQDYPAFYKEEIGYRSLMDYPPAGHMLAMLLEGTGEEDTERFSSELADRLKDDILNGRISEKQPGKAVFLIGPADASVRKINDIYRRIIYLKSKDYESLKKLKDSAETFFDREKPQTVRMTFDFDPVSGY
ncbi:MAG TPA: primosomal protein N', partial [Lachnospiraceae bacterium]|nr:primosomal protein N' [Lachnospiraceae bacterium]